MGNVLNKVFNFFTDAAVSVTVKSLKTSGFKATIPYEYSFKKRENVSHRINKETSSTEKAANNLETEYCDVYLQGKVNLN